MRNNRPCHQVQAGGTGGTSALVGSRQPYYTTLSSNGASPHEHDFEQDLSGAMRAPEEIEAEKQNAAGEQPEQRAENKVYIQYPFLEGVPLDLIEGWQDEWHAASATEGGRSYTAWEFIQKFANQVEQPEPIPGLLPRGEVILIAGDAGAGKSWLGVRMAAEIAAGVSVLGQPARQKQIVLYCLTQGKAGFARRLHAHLELLKIDPKDENNGVRVRDNLPHLIDPQGYGVKASGGLAWFLVISADQHRGKLPKQIDVLFLDYLREASQGAIENSNDDMALVMAAANQLARALNVGIVLFHHQGTNTDKAGRGATVVRDMCYAMLLLIGEVDKGAVEPARLTCDKAPKDHKKLAPICLTLDLTNPGYPVLVYTDEKQVGKATANAIYELLKRLKGQRLSLGDLERELPQPEGISDTAWQARIKRACHAIRDDAVGFPGVDYQERKGLCYATKGAAIAVPYAE